MARKHDEAIKELNEEQKKAYDLLIGIRQDSLTSYRDSLQQILQLLGSQFKVPSEEGAKALFIMLFNLLYGLDDRRDISLMSLRLMIPFTSTKIMDRRRDYISIQDGVLYDMKALKSDEKKELNKRANNLQKREEVLFAHFIVWLSQVISEWDDGFFEGHYNVAIESGYLISADDGKSWRAELPKLYDYRHKKTEIRKIYLNENSITDQEDSLLEDLHQKALSGEKVLLVERQESFSWHMCELYAYKYRNEFDLILKVTRRRSDIVSIYGIASDYEIEIRKTIENGFLCISMPCTLEEIITLTESYHRCLFLYHNYDFRYFKDTSLASYLKSKGLLLC